MLELIAIAYSDETVAGQAVKELERRADDLSIEPDAAAVIICERDANCQLITTRHPGATAAWSRFWGVLFGGVMNEAEESGIDPEFRQQVRGTLTPSTSLLIVAIEGFEAETIIEALSQFGGTVLKWALSAEGSADLWDSLDRGNVRI
jgi:uncharacterized membrane protein